MIAALDRHGTKAFVLKPSAIAAAAEADLVLAKAKRLGQCELNTPYVFHRRHVLRAKCALELVDRAIADRYSGVWSNKRITRIIYRDGELLAAVRAFLSPCAKPPEGAA